MLQSKHLLLSLCLFCLPLVAQASTWPTSPNIQVQGSAILQLEADLVNIESYFSVDHRDSRLALQQLESSFSGLLRDLRRQLPEDVRLEAGNINIQPRYTHQNNTTQLAGYTVTRDLRLLDLPVELAGEWVEKINQARPSSLNLSYHSSRLNDSRHPALEAAVADARAKADILAAALDQRVGVALQISEIASPSPQPRMALMAADSLRMESAPELVPGQLSSSARVSVTFELLPR